MSREAAGAALRALRESRDWSLADLADATGVSIMGLSYLERGTRKAHKGTVRKLENGLGLPPGTYARLVIADDPDAELAALLGAGEIRRQAGDPESPVVVTRRADTEVFEGFAAAQLESINSVIDRLPPRTSSEYENVVRSVIDQCVKAELLAANSWRVAVNSGADPHGQLMELIKALENTRAALMAKLPDSLGARFDRACGLSGLPEHVISELLDITAEQIWSLRNHGVIPPGTVSRIRAFADALGA
ncbi:transcriptional regulator [Mycobacterium sp. MS1601]|uniref:helix-turn-helix domain-containing protein n=1 Tax=Mycobacterium sp. MS1601 TaxID=1936029 RepID=UPI0009790ACC|nr:helix-turn-helix transcriptional regulator [Mycobacterium sp. MS1601]AQA02954.1 transcriptional regulator [Mycobacterium sp. MS1601]